FELQKRLNLLREGTNAVVITARGLKGATSGITREIVLDQRPPEFRLLSQEERGGRVEIKGVWIDENGLSDVGDKSFERPPVTVQVRLSISKGEMPVIKAVDWAGNPLSLTLTGENIRRLAKTSAAAGSIFCVERQEEMRTVSRESIILDGAFPCEREPMTLWLDNDKQLNADGFIWDATAGLVRFAVPVRIDLSRTNRFQVIAKDEAGASIGGSPLYGYIGSRPPFLKKEYRLGVTVPRLWYSRLDLPKEIEIPGSAVIAERVRSSFEEKLGARKPLRFNQYSFREDDLEMILQERRLHYRDLLDPGIAIPFRNLNLADIWFVGNLIHHRNGYEVRLQIVNAVHKTVYGYEDVYVDFSDKNAEQRESEEEEKIQALVDNMEAHHPFVRGLIQRKDRARFMIDLGRRVGLHPGNQFIVIEADEGKTAEDG
ncbi:MAG: hypothetical protein AAF492_25975, partial [Verrucomicrobiota bacterium]